MQIPRDKSLVVTLPSLQKQQSVFVIVPVGNESHCRLVYNQAIEPVLRYLRFRPVRVDATVLSEEIARTIRAEIADCYFCIADLSLERQNCYYEIGLAHGLGKRVIFIKDVDSKAHFDVGGFQIHPFDRKTNLRKVIRAIVPGALVSAKRIPDDTQNHRFGGCPIVGDLRAIGEIRKRIDKTYFVDISVISLSPRRPLTGKVAFHLHRDFPKTPIHVLAKNGRATLSQAETDGPFTVGIEVIATGTRLELDLATIPGGDSRWRKRALAIDNSVL